MSIIKYKLGKRTYYLAECVLGTRDIDNIHSLELHRLSNIVIDKNELIKCRHSVEDMVDNFIGISKEPSKTVNLQLMEDMADEPDY